MERREYRYRTRNEGPKLKPVTLVPVQESQVRLLADSFHRETLDNPALAVEAYLTLIPEDLADLLKAELETAPHSPMSVEIRRRMRILCDEHAEGIAKSLPLAD